MIKILKKDWSIIFDTSHKDAAHFRTMSFFFYNELSWIYTKDRSTGQDAQTTTNILEDITLEENVENDEGIEHKRKFEFGLDNIDISNRVPQTSTSSRRKRKASEIDESITIATILGDKISKIAD
ncbi:hypothetical protein PTKIN_Ptkin04bG0083500 [Pterospermum kingtungense]